MLSLIECAQLSHLLMCAHLFGVAGPAASLLIPAAVAEGVRAAIRGPAAAASSQRASARSEIPSLPAPPPARGAEAFLAPHLLA